MNVAYACDCMYMCVNFGDEIFLRRRECKTWEKFNFFKKGKTLICHNSTGGRPEIFLDLR